MSWTDPRVWVVEALDSDKMNEISEQLAVLHKGNGHSVLQDLTPDSDRKIDIGTVDQSFNVSLGTSSYDLAFIGAPVGRQVGNIIHLIITGSAAGVFIINNAGSVPAGYLPIFVHGSSGLGDYPITENMLLMLTLGNSAWHCKI